MIYTTTATTSEIREIITKYPANIPYYVQPLTDTGIQSNLNLGPNRTMVDFTKIITKIVISLKINFSTIVRFHVI